MIHDGICFFSEILDEKLPVETHSVTPHIEKWEKSPNPSESEGLDVLRDFRDDVLSKSMTGLQLIKLYYKHSQEAADILRENPVLSSRANEVLKAVIGIFQEVDDTNEFGSTLKDLVANLRRNSVPTWLKDEIKWLLDEIYPDASDELKDTIEDVRGLLK